MPSGGKKSGQSSRLRSLASDSDYTSGFQQYYTEVRNIIKRKSQTP